jgi:hypothetical protein
MARLVAEDAVWVSLNYENEDLEQILPCASTSYGRQPFVNVYRWWRAERFKLEELFSRPSTRP